MALQLGGEMEDKELIQKARELKAAQKRQKTAALLTPHLSDLYDLLKADVSLRIIGKTINEKIGANVAHSSIAFFLEQNFPDEYNKYVRVRRNGDGVAGSSRKASEGAKKVTEPKKKGITSKEHKVEHLGANEEVILAKDHQIEPLAVNDDVDLKQVPAKKDQGVGVVTQSNTPNSEPTSSADSSVSGAGENEGERPSSPTRSRKPVNLDGVAIDMYKTTPTRM